MMVMVMMMMMMIIIIIIIYLVTSDNYTATQKYLNIFNYGN